ncbi:hypothetical protein D9M72_485700 [compost metagenome]
MPASVSIAGPTMNMATCDACSASTPTLSRARSALSKTLRNGSRTGCGAGGVGTRNSVTPMATSPSTDIRLKMPDMPMLCSSGEAITSDSAKVRPMLPPTIAIALVRWRSRVRSAMQAVMAAEIAPMPCSARPAMMPVSVSENAATSPPAMNSSRPATITGLRPMRSDSQPSGICRKACIRP